MATPKQSTRHTLQEAQALCKANNCLLIITTGKEPYKLIRGNYSPPLYYARLSDAVNRAIQYHQVTLGNNHV